MPASIAHMLLSQLCRKSLSRERYQEFTVILERHKTYMELGSVGPDLPYYENAAKATLNLLLDRSDKPMGVDQWSYQLHSKNPNIFPLKMIEIAWRESNLNIEEWEEDDDQKFAFICGFLTHIAADQIIHPWVNQIAGPYYKGGDHRERHRECEVYQDVVIYQEVNPGQDLMDVRPNTWCDLNLGFGSNTPVWFRYFLQKAFVEAHSVAPAESSIEDWVDGFLLTLRGLNNVGPYVKAARDFRELGQASDRYKQFYQDIDYFSRFGEAVELGCIYIQTAFELYNVKHLANEERDFFLRVVQDADLSSPLQKDIYKTALDNFRNGLPLVLKRKD
ncbi:MAG: zinc dependent phospholipase C family protein [Syntrophobacterales bacterium]|jgi:hypothetical protein|nr:zinc dependent phospholipase C family protein [Syntrophobacterales bacterium]